MLHTGRDRNNKDGEMDSRILYGLTYLAAALSFVSTDESAAEVVQEAWLAVVAGIARYERRSSLRTWVYRILVNIAKRRGAHENRSVPWSSLSPTDEVGTGTVEPGRFRGPDEPYAGHWREFPNQWPSPEQQSLAGEIRSKVAAALDQLPDSQRIVITLRDIEGYSGAEVSSILDVSAANQRVLLHRARAFVRCRLEDYFAAVGTPSGPPT
jgi:RNA polymerase sigma-70 factor (ECF subfamily)